MTLWVRRTKKSWHIKIVLWYKLHFRKSATFLCLSQTRSCSTMSVPNQELHFQYLQLFYNVSRSLTKQRFVLLWLVILSTITLHFISKNVDICIINVDSYIKNRIWCNGGNCLSLANRHLEEQQIMCSKQQSSPEILKKNGEICMIVCVVLLYSRY